MHDSWRCGAPQLSRDTLPQQDPVDQLSRSLLDIAKVMDRFNAADVAFVGVAQDLSAADAMAVAKKLYASNSMIARSRLGIELGVLATALILAGCLLTNSFDNIVGVSPTGSSSGTSGSSGTWGSSSGTWGSSGGLLPDGAPAAYCATHPAWACEDFEGKWPGPFPSAPTFPERTTSEEFVGGFVRAGGGSATSSSDAHSSPNAFTATVPPVPAGDSGRALYVYGWDPTYVYTGPPSGTVSRLHVGFWMKIGTCPSGGGAGLATLARISGGAFRLALAMRGDGQLVADTPQTDAGAPDAGGGVADAGDPEDDGGQTDAATAEAGTPLGVDWTHVELVVSTATLQILVGDREFWSGLNPSSKVSTYTYRVGLDVTGPFGACAVTFDDIIADLD